MASTSNVEIGCRVRGLRARLGSSTVEVAAATGLEVARVEALEAGDPGAIGTLAAVAGALGVGERWLVGDGTTSALVGRWPELRRALTRDGARGLAGDADRAFHEVVQALDDAARLLGLDAVGESATHAVPHPLRPRLGIAGDLEEVWRLRTVEFMADAHIHGLVTAGKLAETVEACLGDGIARGWLLADHRDGGGGEDAFLRACLAAADEAEEGRLAALRAAALGDG